MVEYAYLKLWKMVNPGAFKGMRKEFLKGQKPAYADAVIGNYVSDFVADICRRYFKRFPIDLDHNIDPSPEWLAQVDDNKADPELLPQPNEDDMDPEEYKNALREWSTRRSAITFRRMVSTCACLFKLSRWASCLLLTIVSFDTPLASKSVVGWPTSIRRTTVLGRRHWILTIR